MIRGGIQQLAERLGSLAKGLPDLLRGTGSSAPLLDAVQTPEQREKLEKNRALLAQLEESEKRLKK